MLELLNANAADVNASNAIVAKCTWSLALSGQASVGPASSRSADGIHSAGGIGGLLANAEGSSAYWFFYDGNGNVTEVIQPPTGTAMQMSAGMSAAGVGEVQAEEASLEETSDLNAGISLDTVVMADDSVLGEILGLNVGNSLGVGVMAAGGGGGGSTPPSYLLAHYEYDAYGNCLYPTPSGSYATINPFRFSTKWCDYELGTGKWLYYYGYRYYSPRLGRWMSRDPIGERGAVLVRQAAKPATGLVPSDPLDENGYTGMQNNAISWFDPDGGQPTTRPNPPTPQSTATIEIWCIEGNSSWGGDPSGWMHCGMKCKEPGAGSATFCEGTGPNDGAGGPGNNGHPGIRCSSVASNGLPGNGWKKVHSGTAPAGSCSCAQQKGNALNAVPGKHYELPIVGSLCPSNSNAALTLVLGCCGISVPTPSAVPGWGCSVMQACGCRTVTRYYNHSHGSIPYDETVPAFCPIGCNALRGTNDMPRPAP